MQPGVQRGPLRSLLDFLERGHALEAMGVPAGPAALA